MRSPRRRLLIEFTPPVKINGWLLRCSECKLLFIGQSNTLTCSSKCRKARSRRAVGYLASKNLQ